MNVRRTISAKFMDDLQDGLLQPILEKIQEDDTLMLALRGTYINIYYRGGNILKLDEQAQKYKAFFDRKYLKGAPLDLPTHLTMGADVSAWVRHLPCLKRAMDTYFTVDKRGAEREFQQLVAWENNRSPIANETEYFITDIEYANTEQHARVDMLGVLWPGNKRQSERSLVPVLIEMKYGGKALDGSSGLKKHLVDIATLLKNNQPSIRETIEKQFNQLRTLKLLDYRQSSRFPSPRLSTAKPQVIFLLANCNPRSSKLKRLLREINELEVQHLEFDLRFFVATFAGYGMHSACMLDANDFSQTVDKLLMKRPTK